MMVSVNWTDEASTATRTSPSPGTGSGWPRAQA